MKVFSVSKSEVQQAVAGLAAATLDKPQAAFIPAGQLLKRIQQGSNGLKKDILGTALRIVAGEPCAAVLPVLTELRAAMKEAKAAGDSSVGTVRAAIAALAARHGADYPVPQWTTAAEARAAQKAAETAPVDPNAPASDGEEQPQATAEEVQARMAAEVEELRAIAVEARRLLAMPDTATFAELLAEMRATVPSTDVESIELAADGTAKP